MSAYLPRHPCSVVFVAAVVCMAAVVGLIVMRRRLGRRTAWLAAIGAVVLVERIVAGDPPGFRMVALIAVLLAAMKSVTASWSSVVLLPSQWLAFLAWPGMRLQPFADLGSPPRPGARSSIVQGARSIILGLAILAGLRAGLTILDSRGPATYIVASVIALPALSLILHFGIIDVVSGFWQSQGVASDRLFRQPLQSKSLTEFWSRRWNVGFSHMIAHLVQRPLRSRLGEEGSVIASFVVSGLLHELAITVPVRAGFGLPTLYFVLHGVLVTAEKHWSFVPGRRWTIAWLVAPLPILFPIPFLRAVVWPLVGL